MIIPLEMSGAQAPSLVAKSEYSCVQLTIVYCGLHANCNDVWIILPYALALHVLYFFHFEGLDNVLLWPSMLVMSVFVVVYSVPKLMVIWCALKYLEWMIHVLWEIPMLLSLHYLPWCSWILGVLIGLWESHNMYVLCG